MMAAGQLAAAPRAAAAVPCRGSAAFRGLQVALRRPARRSSQRSSGMQVKAMYEQEYIREFPNPQFIAEVLQEFPDKMVANAEEARVLYSEAGYKYLDVRPELECDEAGKFKGAVNVPLVNAIRKYNAETQKKEYIKEDNPDFIKLMKRKFPALDTPLLVGCSDGTSYSLDALEALDEAGYTNLVALKGGYYAWFRLWDNNLRRRRPDGYTEAYEHDGDSCGIHGTGAGFARMDAVDRWVPPKF